MPLVLKKQDIQRLGGKYRIEPAPASEEPPAPPPAPVAPVVVEKTPVDFQPVTNALTRVSTVIERGQAEQTSLLKVLAENMAAAGGTWLATVKSRDQHGRILSLEFKQTD